MNRFPHCLAVVLILGSASAIGAQDADEVRAVIERHYTAIHSGDLDAVFDHHLPEMTWFPNEGQLCSSQERWRPQAAWARRWITGLSTST